MPSGPIIPRTLSLRQPGSHPYRVVSTRIKKVQCDCLILCHDTQGFLCHQIRQFLLHWKSSIFISGVDSTRITFSGTFRLITEKKTSSFLWCPRLMFSAPQYPFFPARCSQSATPNWAPGIKSSLCKTAIDCLHRNSFSDHSSKITSKLSSRCPIWSSCA
ncbi:hypothetical protein TNCV_3645911 [Trichonephila clavipes]|nr:hypothetical protein TNCV_3645911 [Trichonephila clavipes]